MLVHLFPYFLHSNHLPYQILCLIYPYPFIFLENVPSFYPSLFSFQIAIVHSYLIHLNLLVDILYLGSWYMCRISYIPSQYIVIVFPPIFSSSFLFPPPPTYSVCFFPFFIIFFCIYSCISIIVCLAFIIMTFLISLFFFFSPVISSITSVMQFFFYLMTYPVFLLFSL